VYLIFLCVQLFSLPADAGPSTADCVGQFWSTVLWQGHGLLESTQAGVYQGTPTKYLFFFF
jgi:hypothetical protein